MGKFYLKKKKEKYFNYVYQIFHLIHKLRNKKEQTNKINEQIN